MMRLVAHAAGSVADKKRSGKGFLSDAEYRKLIHVKSRGFQVDGSEYLRAFDHLTDVFRRTSNNKPMISYWDQLTSEIVEDF